MTTLILNLVGSQSWGNSSNFKRRDAGTEPSKSGVYSLIEAAMGLDRNVAYRPLDELHFGVRADRPGQLEVDFQTAEGVVMAKGSGSKNEVFHKFYLTDAHFIVALEGNMTVLETIQNALLNPKRPIFLGRRAFSPICPVILPDSLQQGSLDTVLETYPWCAIHLFHWQFRSNEEVLRVVIDDPNGHEIRQDMRIGPPALHEYTQRRVRTYTVKPIVPSIEEMVDIQMHKNELELLPASISVKSKKVSKRRNVPPAPTKAPSMIYESRIVFKNPTFDAADMNQIHRFVLDVLGINRSHQKVPILFRLDELEDDFFRLAVRSSQQPDWSQVDQFDLVKAVTKPFQYENLSVGDRFRFGIRVNPTKKRSGKKFGLKEPEQQISWFKGKSSERGGFHIVQITRHIQEERLVKKHGKRLSFTSAVFKGVGEVVDVTLFEKCLWYGLAASGKFAGFNMLQIFEYPAKIKSHKITPRDAQKN